jgi:hypothetical protein
LPEPEAFASGIYLAKGGKERAGEGRKKKEEGSVKEIFLISRRVLKP